MRYRFWKLDERGREVLSQEIVTEEEGISLEQYLGAAGVRVLDWGREGITTLRGGWYAERM
jgi:hypothetical protein